MLFNRQTSEHTLYICTYYRSKLRIPLVITETCNTWLLSSENITLVETCNHEEADTRIVVRHASLVEKPAVVVTANTDIFVFAHSYLQQNSSNGEVLHEHSQKKIPRCWSSMQTVMYPGKVNEDFVETRIRMYDQQKSKSSINFCLTYTVRCSISDGQTFRHTFGNNVC